MARDGDGATGRSDAGEGSGRSMWRTNLKIVGTVFLTIAVYTGIANVIPQVESEVPQRREIGSDVSTSELVDIGEEIYRGAGGCEACHGAGTRAPVLLGEIGGRCGDRVPEQSCQEYLHESLVEPRAFVVEGFQPIMPNVGGQLSDGQIWALVAFLQSQGGEVTVTPSDLEGGDRPGSARGSEAESREGAAGGPSASAGDGRAAELMRRYQCITCHQVDGQGGQVGPTVAAIRERGLSSDYLRRSILRPNADTASGYEQDYAPFAGTMPSDFGERLTEEELRSFVGYLARGDGS